MSQLSDYVWEVIGNWDEEELKSYIQDLVMADPKLQAEWEEGRKEFLGDIGMHEKLHRG